MLSENQPDGAMTREVPASETHELASKSCRYCIAVFVINENGKLLAQLERMRPYADQVDIVIADGGSSDGSTAIDKLADCGVNTLLVKTGAGKLGAQMRMAFAWALGRGYEGIITIDGNNKDDPAAIKEFIEGLDAGYDHLQGSRFIAGGKAINTPPSRYFGVRMVHAPMLSRAAGFRYTDTTNGFRAYSRRFLEDSRVAPFRDIFSGYELHYYLAVRAARLGFQVKEIPVTRAYPGKGPVPTKISPLRGNLQVLKTLVRACRHSFDPPLS